MNKWLDGWCHLNEFWHNLIGNQMEWAEKSLDWHGRCFTPRE